VFLWLGLKDFFFFFWTELTIKPFHLGPMNCEVGFDLVLNLGDIIKI
jgi:hypothetical protein